MSNPDDSDDFFRSLHRFIESWWHEHNVVPSFEQLSTLTGVTLEDIEEAFEDPDFIKLLQSSYFYEAYSRPAASLSTQQLLALNVLTNQYDRRTPTQKFRELKITSQQFNRWMQDPTFARALNERTLTNFQNDGWRVFQSILESAAQGDVNAGKFYMELTGRYTPTSRTQSVNVSLKSVDLLVEVIMRHLGPLPNGQELIEKIGRDFENAINGTLPAPEAIQNIISAPALEQPKSKSINHKQSQSTPHTSPVDAFASSENPPHFSESQRQKSLEFIKSLEEDDLGF